VRGLEKAATEKHAGGPRLRSMMMAWQAEPQPILSISPDPLRTSMKRGPHLSPIPKGHDLGWAYVVLGDVGGHKGHIVVPQSLKTRYYSWYSSKNI
jgi:hypothetical protein